MLKWDERFLKLAQEISTWSKDPRTKCGCVIARDKQQIGMGFNGFPPQIADIDKWYENREIKLKLVIHAESNAIRDAASGGSSIVGCTAYTWPCAPCGECAKELVAWGIKRVVYIGGSRLDFEEQSDFVFNHVNYNKKIDVVKYTKVLPPFAQCSRDWILNAIH